MKNYFKDILVCCCIGLILVVLFFYRESKQQEKALQKEIASKADREKFFSRHKEDYAIFRRNLDMLIQQCTNAQNRCEKIYDIYSITNKTWMKDLSELIAEVNRKRDAIKNLYMDAKIKYDAENLDNEFIRHEFNTEIAAILTDVFCFNDEHLSEALNFYSLLDRHKDMWVIRNNKLTFYNKTLKYECLDFLLLLDSELWIKNNGFKDDNF